MRDWIPGGEYKLIEMCRKWSVILGSVENRTLYKWATELVQPTCDKIDAYLDAASEYARSDTSNNRSARNVTKKAAVEAMRAFATTSVRNNPFMDEIARDYLNVRTPDRTHTVHARPTAVPHTVIETTGFPLQHRVCALNYTSTKKKKPAGVYGVRYVWQVGGERPASGASMLNGRFSRKTEIIVPYDESNRGKQAYYSACYENARGESGPWSLITESYIA